MSTLATFAQMVHGGWAAPELDQQTRTKQSDIFSFACTIYEVLVYFLRSIIVVHIFFGFRCLPDDHPLKWTVVRTIAQNPLGVKGV